MWIEINRDYGDVHDGYRRRLRHLGGHLGNHLDHRDRRCGQAAHDRGRSRRGADVPFGDGVL